MFAGTGITFSTEKNDTEGRIDVYVDNQFHDTIDGNPSSRAAQSLLYSISGLRPGPDTLRLVKGVGHYMVVDRFDITAVTTAAP